jgi:hypothetical protein
MEFQLDKIDNINNGILALTQYFSGMTDIAAFSFSEGLKELFRLYKTEAKYRTDKNKIWLIQTSGLLYHVEFSIKAGGFPAFDLERTDEESEDFEKVYSYYVNAYNACLEILDYFEKLYPNEFADFSDTSPIVSSGIEYDIPPPQQTETKAERETVELKPTFTTEAVPIVFNNIKDYFSVEEQEELKHILETGNKASKKLLFKGRLNGLADTFKRLYENNFIQGCEKRHLEDWIVSNFLFLHRGKAKDIKPKVINKYVSAGGHTICENPLIKIDEGRIQKATDN